MTKPRDPEALLSAYLASGMEVLPDRVVDSVLDEVHRTRQRRALWPAWKPRSMTRTTFAAAVVAAVIALGGAFLVVQRGQPAVGGPSATTEASASPSPAGVAAPSATPTPSPTPTPILWTQASLEEDWPAPVRAEPAGGAIVQPIVATRIPADSESCCLVDEPGRHIDPSGDTGSDLLPWADIREVSVVGNHNLTIALVSNLPPDVDPTEQWIAYGVVFDDDRDGVPDRRFGMDNSPRTVEGHSQVRDWITDLHTGRTLVSINDYFGLDDGGVFIDVSYPGGGGRGANGAHFGFGFEVAGGGTRGISLVDRPLYAWASVIQDGRVVTTDYAPDIGWLDLSVKTTLNSSPQVETTPGPTPRVEDDPDVPGGLLWTVTVVNRSAKPATLIVAEDTATGPGRLVGTVTPSVAPAGATVEAVFALPAKDSTGWAIFVNPDPPDTGPLLVWTDVPLAGEIRITADGNPFWLSP